MRIIAGNYRHRIIKMVDVKTTRETSDKVRGAIFNMILPYMTTGDVLDLFAGSGSMGIEAISRGYKKAVFNDYNEKAFMTIKENLEQLKISKQCEVFNYHYVDCLNKLCGYKFDLICLDPPYLTINNDLLLESVIKMDILKPNGLIVFEMAKEDSVPTHLTIIKEKTYGIKKVIIYQKREQ